MGVLIAPDRLAPAAAPGASPRLAPYALLVTLAAAGGAGVGAVVVALYHLLDLAHRLLFRGPLPPVLAAPVQLLAAAAGFALAARIARRFGGGEPGPDVPQIDLDPGRRGGSTTVRRGVGKATASAVTLACGGSAGAEGPAAVIGATLGAALARACRVGPDRAAMLVGAGVAAGIGGTFGAPLAGAFFVLEVVLDDFSVASLPPVLAASALAAAVSRWLLGSQPAFPIPHPRGYPALPELALLYPALGVVAGLAAALFVGAHGLAARRLHRLRTDSTALPWLAGAAVGALALASGGALVGTAHWAVPVRLFGGAAFTALALLAIGKTAATLLTVDGGGSGGMLTPSLFLGAAVGGAFGVAAATLLPGLSLDPAAYALVGMGAFVAAAAHAPITAILLVFEMTGDFQMVPPLLLAVVLAFLVGRAAGGASLYALWRAPGGRIQPGADPDLLAGIPVADAYEPHPRVIPETAPVPELMLYLGSGEQDDFPVVDGAGRLVGLITLADLACVARDQEHLGALLVAADIAQPTETVGPDASLLEASRRMSASATAALPVVDAAGHLRGLLTRAHLRAAYQRAVSGTPDAGLVAGGGTPAAVASPPATALPPAP